MPNTITDTATGESRPVEVGPVNTLSFSTTPQAAPEPALSLGDIDKAKLRQMQPLPTHDTSTNIPTAPVPSHVPNLPMPFMSARPSMGKDALGTPVPQAWLDADYAKTQALQQGVGRLTDPLGLTDYGQQLAAFGEPDSPEKRAAATARQVGGLTPMGTSDPEFAPLRGFFSRFETEVIPRLPKIAQNPKTISNLVEKFVPKDQWEWMGGPQWLESLGGKSVTKADVEAWFQKHQPTFFEHYRGTPPNSAATLEAYHAAQNTVDDATRSAKLKLNSERAALGNDETDHRVQQIDSALQTLQTYHDYGISRDAPPPAEYVRADVGDVHAAYLAMNKAREANDAASRGHASPKWQQYTEPGGTNYHERLVVAPQKMVDEPIEPLQWESEHVPDQKLLGTGEAGPITTYRYTSPRTGTSGSMTDYSQHPARANITGTDNIYGPGGHTYRTVEDAKAAIEQDVHYAAARDRAKELQYSHSHFSDVPNYFFHQRMKERDVEGVGKTLFSEEDQSDAHQAGRYNGYRQLGDKAKANATMRVESESVANLKAEAKATGDAPAVLDIADTLARATDMTPDEIVAQIKAGYDVSNADLVRKYAEQVRVAAKAKHVSEHLGEAPPDMPFKKSWPELGLRLQIRDAVDRGADAIGWTTGQQQIKRYGNVLNEKVGEIKLEARYGDTPHLRIFDRHGQQIDSRFLQTTDEIADVVGKTEAKRLLAQPRAESGSGFTQSVKFATGEDFRLGGEGHIQFYDKQRVALAEKIGKEFGTQPELLDMQERVQKPKAARSHSSDYSDNPWMDRDGHVIEEPPTEYEPDYDSEPVVPDEDPQSQMEDFEANYDDMEAWVKDDEDDLETNAEDTNEVLDHIRAAHPDLFDHPAAQQDLVSDIGRANPDTAPRSGVHFEVRDVPTSYSGQLRRGAGTEYQIVARFPDGTERRIAGPDDAEFEDEADAIATARHLQTGGEAEPTKWRYRYSDDGTTEDTSDWYDSPREAVRAAENYRDEQYSTFSDEQYNERYSELRQEYRQAERAHEEWESEEEARREQWHAARDQWEAQGEQEWNGDATDHVVPEATPKDDNTQLVSRGKVWIMKITDAMRAAVKKGQPLPEILAPLTGAGMALMASHKRAAQ